MDSVHTNTDGMQGFLNTNGDLVDTLSWDDLEDIQWISMNITDTPIDELSRRMQIVGERSNVIGQTVVATLDDHNLERYVDRGFDVHTTFLFDTLIPLWDHDSSPHPCGRRLAAGAGVCGTACHTRAVPYPENLGDQSEWGVRGRTRPDA